MSGPVDSVSLDAMRAGATAVLALIVVKASVIIAVGALVTSRAERKSAAQRSAWWTAVVIGLIALPVLTAALPRIQVPLGFPWESPAVAGLLTAPVASPPSRTTEHTSDLPGRVVSRAREATGSGIESERTVSLRTAWAVYLPLMFVVAWAAGTIVMFCRIAAGFNAARRVASRASSVPEAHPAHALMRSASTALGFTGPVALSVSHEVRVPSMLGLTRPHIILPVACLDWTDDRLHAALVHELAHVARADYGVRTCWELARTLYWVNPLIWYAAARARTEMERAADDRVVRCGVNPVAYAEQLLALARCVNAKPTLPALTLASVPLPRLKERIRAILAATTDRRPVSRLATLASTSLLVGVSIPVGALGGGDPGRTAPATDPPMIAVADPVVVTRAHRADSASWALTATSSARDSASFHLLFASLPARRLAAARTARTIAADAIVDDVLAVFREATGECSAMRWRAARGLRELGDPRAVPLLVEQLIADPDSNVRAMVANAIAAAGSDDGARLLHAALIGAPPAVFGQVGRALDTLGDTRAHRVLLRALREARARTRANEPGRAAFTTRLERSALRT